MDELKQIDRLVKPDQVFLVCDAMTGQDAVNSAKAFNDALDLNGVILTKLDGDARGGAALSIKEVTKVPIKFIGVGEKLDRLEEFHPERMAQRILGQGDLMGLIEKVGRVQQELSQEEIEKQQEKLAKGDFTLDDFRKQFEQMKKMGGMKDMIGQHARHGRHDPRGRGPRGSACKRIQGMIDSMTKEERRNPDIIDLSRRRRIADGQRHRAARGQAVPQPVRPGPHAHAADGQDEHLGAASRWSPAWARRACSSPAPMMLEDQGRHRPPQERQGAGRGAQEETKQDKRRR